ncbi:MAG: M20 family metallopeptidase [Bacteroidales bacterium]
MMSIKEKVNSLVSEMFDELVSMRRHLHSKPELSLQEYETASFIAKKLDEYGIKYDKGIAKTGVVALIEGKNPSKTALALRADMDALPIHETNETDYISKKPGVMHACGHDVHMACLLGAAKILKSMSDEFEGTVKLIFQPSEETYPGGAITMIKEGILENPVPEVIFGQHVFPGLDAGSVGVKAGKYMASTDEVYLVVKGKGGHAATPHLNIDPVVIASNIVVALQQVVSRISKPYMPSVLSFGKIIGEGRNNIIPDEVRLDGTFRTFDEEWRAQAHEKINNIASGVARSMGGDCEVRIEKGYPFLVNDINVVEDYTKYAREFLGKENVEELELAMTAEDFAYFSHAIPSCFYRLGIRNMSKNITSNLHTSTFDVDEESLKTGAGLMAFIAINWLNKK